MKRFPFPLKFSIPTILIFCGSLLGITSFHREIAETYQKTESNHKNYVQLIAGQTSRVLDYLYRRKDIQGEAMTIISQMGSDPNLNLVLFINDQNVVEVSTRYDLNKLPLNQTPAKNYSKNFEQIRKNLTGKVFFSKNKEQLIAIYPVFLEVLSQEIRPSRIGILFLEYDLIRLKQEAYYDALKRSLVSTAIFAFFCLGLWFFFELVLTRRVLQLVSASNDLAEGRLNVRAELSGSDELVEISEAFDRMAHKIEENTLILKQELTQRQIIEAQLKEVNQNLSISNQELAEATKAKSEFLANMSHEIRTPMNGVIGMAQLLSMTYLTEEQRELVHTILDSADALVIIINDILDFSKIESGNFELDEYPFRIKDVVKSVCSLFSQQATRKEIELNYYLDSNLPQHILGDGSRLRQILLNILGNAIKFTHQGVVSLTVEKILVTEDCESKKYQLMVTVKDTGIGIEVDRIQKLFHAFTQADASISRQYGGTGLGLAISKSLVHLMGGTIWVESQDHIAGNPPDFWLKNKIQNPSHQGSTFYFTVTVKEALETDITQQQSLQQFSDFLIDHPIPFKIILAEDNKVNQKVALLSLKKLGYSADIANNGLEVLEMIKKQSYNIILMDMQMPEMDGITTTQIIRQLTIIQPWIIAVTANVLETDQQICYNAGMNDFIAKPIRVESLIQALRRVPIHLGETTKRFQ